MLEIIVLVLGLLCLFLLLLLFLQHKKCPLYQRTADLHQPGA